MRQGEAGGGQLTVSLERSVNGIDWSEFASYRRPLGAGFETWRALDLPEGRIRARIDVQGAPGRTVRVWLAKARPEEGGESPEGYHLVAWEEPDESRTRGEARPEA